MGRAHARGHDGLRDAAEIRHPDVRWLVPMHRNPVVREVVVKSSAICPQRLADRATELPRVLPCHASARYLLLTDSGGVQEEAPSLGKPVLVMRDTTERPEAVTAGTVRLIGTAARRCRRIADEAADRRRRPTLRWRTL